jgi:hypothetical protein
VTHPNKPVKKESSGVLSSSQTSLVFNLKG